MHLKSRVIVSVVIVCTIFVFTQVARLFKNDALNAAAWKGDLNTVKALLDNGAEVDGRSLHYMTPLMSVAKGGQIETARFLLNKGADVHGHSSGSVLMWAAASGNAKLVRLFIQRKVNVNFRSDSGNTALETAVEFKHPEIIKNLKQAGAKS